MTARGDFRAGVRAVSPLMLGVVPFALVAGITAVDAGLTTAQAVGMSVVVFAGAAQLAAIELIGETAPAAVVVLTAVVINLRFVMYSASIAPHFRRFGAPTKWLSAYLLTDQAYALSVTEYGETEPTERSRLWFYLGTAVTLWVVWQVGTLAGALVGATIPAGFSLEFAVPLTFLALLFHALDDRPTRAAALVGGGGAALAAPLPFNLGLVTGAIAGIALGVVVERRAGAFPTAEGAADDRSGDDRGDDDCANDDRSGDHRGNDDPVGSWAGEDR